MGYMSEVCLIVALRSKTQADELMAVYALHPLVQKHDLVGNWDRYVRDDVVFLVYRNFSIKWYEDYEHVQGMEYLLDLARTFSKERTDVGWLEDGADKPELTDGFPYAAYKLRIGEEMKDIEEEAHDSQDSLMSDIYDRAYMERSITLNF
jgi:hypothetical protein